MNTRPPAVLLALILGALAVTSFAALGGTSAMGVPRGTIIAWYVDPGVGNSAGVPTGWRICDGQDGTPDLRGKFLLGAASVSRAGLVGGSKTHRHRGQSQFVSPGRVQYGGGGSTKLAGGSNTGGAAGSRLVEFADRNPVSVATDYHDHSLYDHDHGIEAHSHDVPGHRHSLELEAESNLPPFASLVFLIKS